MEPLILRQPLSGAATGAARERREGGADRCPLQAADEQGRDEQAPRRHSEIEQRGREVEPDEEGAAQRRVAKPQQRETQRVQQKSGDGSAAGGRALGHAGKDSARTPSMIPGARTS